MNAVHVHLILNHVPVVGVLLGAVVLAGALVRRHPGLQHFALWLLIAMGVLIVPTYLSGESAEEIVEPAIVDAAAWIEPHEEAAGFAGFMTVLTAAAAAATLAYGRGHSELPRRLVIVTIVVALLASAALARTATLGGFISHTEIRP
jgi:hypothetical protein